MKQALLAAVLAAAASSAWAQEPPVPSAEAAPPAQSAACCVIPAGTVVELEVTETVTTKTNVRGDKFGLRLVRPIEVDGKVLVPADATGVGEVVHAAKAGMAGKAAELIVAARYLTHDGVRIPLRGFTIVAHSKSQTDEATAAFIAIGVVSLLVKADETRVNVGARATAKVSSTVTLPPRDEAASPLPVAQQTPLAGRTDSQ